jgi:hypothetical protein
MSSSTVSGGGSSGLALSYDIAIANKITTMREQEGAAIVNLIQSSMPSMPTVAPGGNPTKVGGNLNIVG